MESDADIRRISDKAWVTSPVQRNLTFQASLMIMHWRERRLATRLACKEVLLAAFLLQEGLLGRSLQPSVDYRLEILTCVRQIDQTPLHNFSIVSPLYIISLSHPGGPVGSEPSIYFSVWPCAVPVSRRNLKV